MVTGVGQGSADKIGQKGSEHLFVGVEKLVGPRVVLAGQSSVPTGAQNVTVEFPQPLDGIFTDYAIFMTPFSTASSLGATGGTYVQSLVTITGGTVYNPGGQSAYSEGLTVGGGAQLAGFVAFNNVGNSGTFFWEVVRVNNATVQVN